MKTKVWAPPLTRFEVEMRDFGAFLAQFDETEWPEADGPTYTQFWLEDYWRRGGRLAALSDHFQDSVHHLHRAHCVDRSTIAIEFLSRAALGTLTFGARPLAAGQSPRNLIFWAVRKSGLRDWLEAGCPQDVGVGSTRWTPPKRRRSA